MKSVIVVFVIALFVGISSPQESFATKLNSNCDVSQKDEVEYKIIDNKELPEKTTSTLAKSFVGYSISKAYKGTDNSFKVALSKDTDAILLYFDADGEFLKKETDNE